MGISKSISLVIANLKVAYPYFFKDLSDEEFIGLISMYQENFKNCNEQVLLNTVKKIIKVNKFMPSISQILDKYQDELRYYFINLLKNSNIADEEREYLISMVDWYSLKSEYPKDLLDKLSRLSNIQISKSEREVLTYDN